MQRWLGVRVVAVAYTAHNQLFLSRSYLRQNVQLVVRFVQRFLIVVVAGRTVTVVIDASSSSPTSARHSLIFVVPVLKVVVRVREVISRPPAYRTPRASLVVRAIRRRNSIVVVVVVGVIVVAFRNESSRHGFELLFQKLFKGGSVVRR
jgi:hypothetical protein